MLAPIPLVTYAFTDEVRDHIRSYLRMENGAQVAALANTPLTSLEVLRPFYAQPGPLALVATRPRYPLYPDQHSRIYPKRCGTQSIGPHHARRGGEIVLANPGVRGLLSSVVLKPTWDIPSRMVQQEIIPRIRRDPSYLSTHHIALIQGKGENATVISPDAIDWSQASFPNFPYRLRQRPGSTNPLGRMKFMLANPFQITLHDTPSRDLFAEARRAKSHGCIRLEKPLVLAEYLLQEDSRWTRMTLLGAIDRGEPQQVFLPAPIPVYLIYHTAWVDVEGRLHFRPDIYGWDTDFSLMSDNGQPAACG